MPRSLSIADRKRPGAASLRGAFMKKGLERREIEKRIYIWERSAAHGFRVLSVIKIQWGFEHRIKKQ
jgi:hypothetical protein